MTKQLNLFDFSDYRRYIKARIEYARLTKAFHLTRLAEAILVHPTFLSQVLNGTKSLSLEQAALMSDYFSHSRLEQEYFFILIQVDRAGTPRLKEILSLRKKEIESEKNRLTTRIQNHRQLNEEQRMIFYSSWIYVATWAASGIGDGITIQHVADMFAINKTKAEEILSFLFQSGLCLEKNGRFTPGEIHVHIPNESPLVTKHHVNWRIKAIEKMDQRSNEELFFTSPMSISLVDFDKLREKFNISIKEVLEVARNSSSEEVVCLNIDFFKLKTKH